MGMALVGRIVGLHDIHVRGLFDFVFVLEDLLLKHLLVLSGGHQCNMNSLHLVRLTGKFSQVFLCRQVQFRTLFGFFELMEIDF